MTALTQLLGPGRDDDHRLRKSLPVLKELLNGGVIIGVPEGIVQRVKDTLHGEVVAERDKLRTRKKPIGLVNTESLGRPVDTAQPSAA